MVEVGDGVRDSHLAVYRFPLFRWLCSRSLLIDCTGLANCRKLLLSHQCVGGCHAVLGGIFPYGTQRRHIQSNVHTCFIRNCVIYAKEAPVELVSNTNCSCDVIPGRFYFHAEWRTLCEVLQEVTYYQKLGVKDFENDVMAAEACHNDVEKFCKNIRPGVLPPPLQCGSSAPYLVLCMILSVTHFPCHAFSLRSALPQVRTARTALHTCNMKMHAFTK